MKLALSFTFLSTAAAFTRPAGTGMPFMVQKSARYMSSNEFDSMTEEEEIEELTRREVEKGKRISNLRNANGVDYAPWMNISEEDERNIREQIKRRTAARRAKQASEQDVSGSLLMDSQAQELSGGGLSYKVMGDDVELEWGTTSEEDTAGFRVSRRPAKTEDWQTIASFETWGPLASQGPNGGFYRYFDADIGAGGWVYRITEVDNSGEANDLCQCLVEVQTEDEQRAAMIAGIGFGVVAVGSVVAASFLDPLNGYN
mmetsp:Transcript_13277/g.17382  ORF Transcript_13277/g.17382 Transcript_13277/m.17382 type:complete len:258 (+) Transcript_13277:212-985(+)|eukprot:CAMPEP_0116066668 /NCGR_PEP_ID=MMETSP0322-20121206/10528_1 /TAXON_ID=163516 /ORGANISM="Leptocylindrus danicus var. apora, Strain B651" /LENGTH=257 /DNA_ID=CAMNT_0003553283 /DNA_START=135 /DNA_END=908 /DNA_ORIENTATION=+